MLAAETANPQIVRLEINRDVIKGKNKTNDASIADDLYQMLKYDRFWYDIFYSGAGNKSPAILILRRAGFKPEQLKCQAALGMMEAIKKERFYEETI